MASAASACSRHPAAAEPPLDVIVDQRPRGSTGWSLATRCTTVVALTDAAACRLDLRATRELRVTVVTTGETGISAIRLY